MVIRAYTFFKDDKKIIGPMMHIGNIMDVRLMMSVDGKILAKSQIGHNKVIAEDAPIELFEASLVNLGIRENEW